MACKMHLLAALWYYAAASGTLFPVVPLYLPNITLDDFLTLRLYLCYVTLWA